MARSRLRITFTPGSTYEVDINASGQSDRIYATAAASIHGGLVDVRAGAGAYQPGMSYTILTAAGGRTGAFDGVSSNLAFLTPTLRYDDNNVYLTLTRNSACFCNVAETPNQAETGAGVENQGAGDPVHDAVVNLTAQQARDALEQLAGEIYSSSAAVMLEDSRFIRNAVADRIRVAYGGLVARPAPAFSYRNGKPLAVAANTPGPTLWSHVVGARGHWDGDRNATRVGRSLGGSFAGIDVPVPGYARLGIVAGFNQSVIKASARRSTEISDNYHFGLYGGAQFGAIGFLAGAASTWHDMTTARHVTFPGFNGSLNGRTKGRTQQAFTDIGFRTGLNKPSFEPFGSFAWVRHQREGFAESGGAPALTVAPAAFDATYTTLGLRAGTQMEVLGAALSANASVGWRRAFGKILPTTRMRFARGDDDFLNGGAPLARNAVVVEAGLVLVTAPLASVAVQYDGQFASRLSDQSLRASVTLGF